MSSNTGSLTTAVSSSTAAAKSATAKPATGDKKKAIPWDEQMRAFLTEKEKDMSHITKRVKVRFCQIFEVLSLLI